ncbi:MAG TPA: hypothetical protein VMG98_13355 [Verrucomicrobiae bacterium]|nr:hypothetical protein [Verrucomicrobiae bacterium]
MALKRARGRLLGSFLASLALNLIAWTAAIWLGNPIRSNVPAEVIAMRTTRVRVERAAPPTPRPSPTPKPKRSMRPQPPRNAVASKPVTPPITPTLSLPHNWQTTYMGSAGVNDRDVRLWLDWSHQSAEFVPRIYLWHRTIDALDPREVTLRDAVNGIVAQLKDEGSVIFYADRPERVCGGRYPGWFLSYDKRDGDPKIHIDDVLLIAHNSIYRATYVRTLDEAENSKTREALHSLC